MIDHTEKGALARFVDWLGSTGLACILLICLFVLTVLGTVYQVDYGLYAAKQRFFLSWFLWWSPGGGSFSIPVFPGGITSMGLLAVNLLLGGLFRMRIRTGNIGVVVVHVGIVFLLLAGLVKTYGADEGILRLTEGESASHFTNEREWEVAIWRTDDQGRGAELVIEQEFFGDLTGGGERTFTSAELPFDLVLSYFAPNSRVMRQGPNWVAHGPFVDGYGLLAQGPAGDNFRDIAGMHAEARGAGAPQRGILWGFERLPWTVSAGGAVWAVSLRPARYPMPFTLRLEDFEKEDHPGMAMAKAFRSRVTKIDGQDSERILIQMNEPLRDEGLVFFQSSWGPQNARPGEQLFSVFSVVRNPSDKWPEYSLWVITAGLVLAFGQRLFQWIVRQRCQQRTQQGLTQ